MLFADWFDLKMWSQSYTSSDEQHPVAAVLPVPNTAGDPATHLDETLMVSVPPFLPPSVSKWPEELAAPLIRGALGTDELGDGAGVHARTFSRHPYRRHGWPDAGLVSEVEHADHDVRAAAAGTALVTMFGSHLAKENDLVLPLLSGSPDVSVAELLKGMQAPSAVTPMTTTPTPRTARWVAHALTSPWGDGTRRHSRRR
jgi:hypothetical protein